MTAVLCTLIAGCTLGKKPPATTPEMALKDLTYCTLSGTSPKLDLYIPARGTGRSPVVVYLHGGGWNSGGKGIPTNAGSLGRRLLDRGFAVASVDYSLLPAFHWPVPIIDAKCAVRYLRTIADVYSLDPGRIGALGGSAGGHLASMLGTAGSDAGFDLGEYLDKSSAVQAVAVEAGPSDLTSPGFPADTATLIAAEFGAQPGQPLGTLVKASPVTYVRAGAPPFLIIHGDKDEGLPPAQSSELAQKLQAVGGSPTLLIVQNANHVLEPAGSGPMNPTPDQLNQRIVDFFASIIGA